MGIMRQPNILLKIALLFVLVFNVILCTAAQAKTPDGYTLMAAEGSGITTDSTLAQTSSVTFKMDFSNSDGYDWKSKNNNIIEDGDYLCYGPLPNTKETDFYLDETLTVTYKDAVVDGGGNKYDLEITFSNMHITGYNKSAGKDKNLRIFKMDTAPWIEAWITGNYRCSRYS